MIKLIRRLIGSIQDRTNKSNAWIMIIVSAEDGVVLGDVSVLEYENKEELIEELNFQKNNGQDLNYIRIYPPNSELTLKEIGYKYE